MTKNDFLVSLSILSTQNAVATNWKVEINLAGWRQGTDGFGWRYLLHERNSAFYWEIGRNRLVQEVEKHLRWLLELFSFHQCFLL